MEYTCDNCHFVARVPLYAYGNGLTLCEDCFDLATKGKRFPDSDHANVSWDDFHGEPVGTLLVRSTAGIHVRVRYLAEHDAVGLEVKVGEREARSLVPEAEVLEAFAHPFLYLRKEAVSELVQR